ncbi:bifunctional adenosylcobinamide kinase/adenosylcobinamide-phosphate guanylyltransferase [Geofilum rubicundum]|uniref:Adenosylcobinamide kinase n=1 Tax=Geofilum rubicundum JCM 15548 TaxID=1236989 RepID=A0A0E9LR75_9BACT|nr:bifunctional adenosylcobinamide kinase/adenosylcobinamide-phosphate guanylyltransferase [Geofilum rubicundum]GAO28077.1 adenosylcobinamide-phosphate guanylyltransferase [Geofilum rubicundum JCM 15548]
MAITFITGGQRSGKSSYAQQLAEAASDQPVYLATARHWDEDFTQRIQRHQNDRGPQWTTVEEEKHLGSLDLENKTILLDCITLWLTNIFHDNNYDVDAALKVAKNEWDHFIQKNNQLFVVSNELGMGIHAQDEASRKFTDLQGWMNQYIAKKSDQVLLMVAGLPLKVK